MFYHSGALTKYLEDRLVNIREKDGLIDTDVKASVIDEYAKNSNFIRLS